LISQSFYQPPVKFFQKQFQRKNYFNAIKKFPAKILQKKSAEVSRKNF